MAYVCTMALNSELLQDTDWHCKRNFYLTAILITEENSNHVIIEWASLIKSAYQCKDHFFFQIIYIRKMSSDMVCLQNIFV